MALTTHPHAVPDALRATLPAAAVETVHDEGVAGDEDADDPDDRLGRSCRTCSAGTYGPGPGAGHVTCDACGHATVRHGTVGRRLRRR